MVQAIQQDPRYERKFICSPDGPSEVIDTIRRHPSHFREIFHQRAINNIYLDTPQLDLFLGNLDGAANRVKIRVRWYGDPFGPVDKPVLEFKRKNGLMGVKDSFRLRGFHLADGCDEQLIEQCFNASEIAEDCRLEMQGCSPAIINRYQRRYFLSADGSCRITLDWDLQFYRWSGASLPSTQSVYTDERVILEVKYAVPVGPDIDLITEHFPYRLSRFSKYVVGIEAAGMGLAC